MFSRIMLVVVASLSFSLTACAAILGAPGHITEKQSTFDNSTQLSMEPAFVFRHADGFSGSDLQLSLFWRSTMQPGQLVLVAYVDGTHNFEQGQSLFFNIDGEIVGFESIDQLTDITFKPGIYDAIYIAGTNVSSKRYLISPSFLEKILNAKDVRVKLNMSRTFVEGVFSDNTMSSAKRAFIEFQKKLQAQK